MIDNLSPKEERRVRVLSAWKWNEFKAPKKQAQRKEIHVDIKTERNQYSALENSMWNRGGVRVYLICLLWYFAVREEGTKPVKSCIRLTNKKVRSFNEKRIIYSIKKSG